ncbi:MAG TPA: DUF6709 family protein [Blastocatellia bacterium]|nr:DUF6709 family protein [Blastocatellia bacterium]
MPSKKCDCCGLDNAPTASVCAGCGAYLSGGTLVTPGPGGRPPARPLSERQSTAQSPRASGLSYSGFIAKQIRRANRNLAIANLILISVVIGAGVVAERYLYNCFFGPFPIDKQSLKSIQDPDSLQRYYVQVHGDDVADTGFRYEEDGKQTAGYVALFVDQKLLLAKTDPGASGADYAGAIVMIPDAERRNVIAKTVSKNPQLASAFLPVMQDATNFRLPGQIGVAIGFLLLALALWNLNKSRARNSDPNRHPIIKSLQAIGPPEAISNKIDSEISLDAGTAKIRSILLTPSFMLRSSLFGLNVLPMDNLIWAYKKVVKHYTNFVPTGKTYSVVIMDRGRRSREMRLRKEKEVDSLLAELRRRVPWVLFGFSKELAAGWKSSPNAVIQAVDERRGQIQNPPAGGAAGT